MGSNGSQFGRLVWFLIFARSGVLPAYGNMHFSFCCNAWAVKPQECNEGTPSMWGCDLPLKLNPAPLPREALEHVCRLRMQPQLTNGRNFAH